MQASMIYWGRSKKRNTQRIKNMNAKTITAEKASELGLSNIYGTASYKASAREAKSKTLAERWVATDAQRNGGPREGMWVWEVIDMGGRSLGWAAFWN